MKIHVFIGKFLNRELALKYTEPFWEPEPNENVSDEEYNEWEDRNPIFEMANDLDCFLDSDFIETITDSNKTEYLKSMLEVPSKINATESELNSEKSVLVLIFEKAINSEDFSFGDTPKLKYKGVFESILK